MAVLAVLESTLPSFCLSYKKIQHNEATVAVLTVLAVSAVMASESGKEKTHKHKQICGIVPGLGGCQNVVYVLFFRVIP